MRDKKVEKEEKREQGSGRDGLNQERRHVTSQGRLSTILYIWEIEKEWEQPRAETSNLQTWLGQDRTWLVKGSQKEVNHKDSIDVAQTAKERCIDIWSTWRKPLKGAITLHMKKEKREKQPRREQAGCVIRQASLSMANTICTITVDPRVVQIFFYMQTFQTIGSLLGFNQTYSKSINC